MTIMRGVYEILVPIEVGSRWYLAKSHKGLRDTDVTVTANPHVGDIDVRSLRSNIGGRSLIGCQMLWI